MTRTTRVWQAVADAYQHRYGVPWDPSGKDVSRLCYVSHDPELYLNLNAEVFDVPPAPPPEPRPRRHESSMGAPVLIKTTANRRSARPPK